MAKPMDVAKKIRVERCQEKIQAILREENCELEAAMIVSRRGAFPQISIVAKEEKVV